MDAVAYEKLLAQSPDRPERAGGGASGTTSAQSSTGPSARRYLVQTRAVAAFKLGPLARRVQTRRAH